MPNIFDFNPTSINPFPYWKWNKVLPAVYDDSLSQYEILCKLLDTVNNIITSTNSTGEQVEQLTQLVQQLIDGQFPEGIVQYVNDLVDAAINERIGDIQNSIASLQAAIDEIDNASIVYAKEQLSNFYSLYGNYCPSAIIEPMETFIDNNDKLFYSTTDTQSVWLANQFSTVLNKYVPMDVRGRVSNGVVQFPGSCSPIVLSGLMGIDYYNSRYANGTGTIITSGTDATLTGGVNIPYSGAGFLSPQVYAAAAAKYGSGYGWLHSWQMAHYFYDLGVLRHIDEDFDYSILKPGDILFYENWTGEATHWQNINHVEVFCGFRTTSTGLHAMAIQGQSTGDYAAFTSRNCDSNLWANQLKWFARFPTVGVTPRNLTPNITPFEITADGWTNIPFYDTTVRVRKNHAFSAVIEFNDNWRSQPSNLHFNVGLYPALDDPQQFDGAYASIYFDRHNQVGPNTFVSCGHTNELEGARVRLQTVGTPSNLVVKDIRVYDGIIGY